MGALGPQYALERAWREPGDLAQWTGAPDPTPKGARKLARLAALGAREWGRLCDTEWSWLRRHIVHTTDKELPRADLWGKR